MENPKPLNTVITCETSDNMRTMAQTLQSVAEALNHEGYRITCVQQLTHYIVVVGELVDDQ